MSNTNGFHPSSSSMSDDGINDTGKHVSSASDNHLPVLNKRLKSKNNLLITVDGTRPMKKLNKKQKLINAKKKRLIHSDSNNNSSTKKVTQYSHSNLERIPSTSSNKNDTPCDLCGEYYNEMISCNTCSSTFHLLCINPPLSNEDISKGSYYCENCRRITKSQDDFITKDKQQKLILPFSFDPKKNLLSNGFKKNQSTIGQIKLPTASDGRSLVQPSGEIKFRATCNNKSKQLSSSTSNLKRKRIDSSSSPPPPSSTINSPVSNTQLEALNRLFLSCQSEEFHGPSLQLNNPNQKHCFICRKSPIKQGPSIQCDYCPLIYHIDCLTPSLTSLPLSNEKWMCPNHMEPILDRYLSQKTNFSTTNRVKFYQQYSQIEQNTIIQDFTHKKQTKEYLLSNTINNHRLERIDISQIPKTIEEFYSKANIEQKQIEINDYKEESEEIYVQPPTLPSNESSYDPSIWDILQAILDHIVNDHTYQFSSIENDQVIKSTSKNECNTLDTIDTLLQALNEPDKTDDLKQKQISPLSTNSFSHLIDLSQFHLSHAALIHLHSRDVIYIRKHVIWFGSSPLNDICLSNFNHSHSCPHITERHACLYYDRKRNLFELLNYSEYGTIVNELRYGLGSLTDDDQCNKQENETLEKCFCLNKALYHSDWDGPAQIEQGTVIKIGCHEFLFYRHIVR